MADDLERAVAIRRWRYLWWEYSVVRAGLGFQVEVRGSLLGSNLSVRHDWWKWTWLVGLCAAAFAIMTSIVLWGTVAATGALSDAQAFAYFTFTYLIYTFVAYASLKLIYNTLAAYRALKKRWPTL